MYGNLKRLTFGVIMLLCMAGPRNSPTTLVASAPPNYCSERCNWETSCSQECLQLVGEEWMPTTCGEWGAYSTTYCNVMEWNSCDWICPQGGQASDQCNLNGILQTCSDYGDYSYCGDGYCAVALGEDVDSCSQDCSSPTTVQAEPSTLPEAENWTAFAEAVNSAVTSNGESVDDANVILSLAYSYSIAEDEVYIDISECSAPVPMALEGDDGSPASDGESYVLETPQEKFRSCSTRAGITAGAAIVLQGIATGLLGVGVICTPCAAAAAAAVVVVEGAAFTVGGISLGAITACLYDFVYDLLNV